MRLEKTLKKQSIVLKLNKINTVRCCYASFLTILVTVVLLLMQMTGSRFQADYKGYIIAGNLSAFIFIIASFAISRMKKNAMLYRIATDVYIIGMEIILLFMAYRAFEKSSNGTVYIGAVAFLAVVPVFYSVEMYAAFLAQLAVMLFFLLSFMKEPESVFTIVVCHIIAYAVTYSRYDTTCNRIVAEERLYSEMRISERDPMTGLLNRRGMDKKVRTIYPLCNRHKIPVGVIMLDIDEFKKYNDTFGHPQGDACIEKVSEVLLDTAKRTTDVIARVGGEEFLIFVQEMQKDDLIFLASRIQKNVEALNLSHASNALYKNITISIGLAYGNPRTGASFEKLYEEADQALYLAKKNGRNCIGMSKRIVYRNRNTQNRAIAK